MNILHRRVLTAAVLILASIASVVAQSSETVYVTRTGAKYHRASCRSLAKSKIDMPLVQAAARYSPCRICKPPLVTTSDVIPASPGTPERVAPASRVSESVQCQATTKKGTQCSRRAKAASRYCWQHGA
jgi:hypothetical protein